MQKKILYISYDGMTDPLGRSQVIPYLTGLSKKGYSIDLISFEKKKNEPSAQESAVRNIVSENNITWRPLTYTKSPPVLSTLWDIFRMRRKAFQLHRKENFLIVHCRSYIASLIGLSMKRKTGVKFLFDMRGFWADERVEGGLWNLKNPLYKLIYKFFKKKEAEFFNEADYVISLTHAGEKEIHTWKNLKQPVAVEVIPCCADFTHFSPERINPRAIKEKKDMMSIGSNDYVLSYIGSVSTWYRLDEMFRFFKFIQKKKSSAKFLFITNDSFDIVITAAKRNGLGQKDFIIIKCPPESVPENLTLADLSVFFYKDGFSRCAVSPTKQAEVMGMGIPHICNIGVGDVEMIVKESGAGYAVTKFDDEEFERAFSFISELKLTRDEIRQAAIKFYSLENGVEKYKNVYEKILLKN